MPRKNQNRVRAKDGLNVIAYTGVNAYSPPTVYMQDRPPTSNDCKNYILGDLWIVNVDNDEDANPPQFWFLWALPTGFATWIRLANDADVAKQITTLNDGNVAIPLLGNWNFEGINGIEVLTPVNLDENITFGLEGDVAQEFPTDDGIAIPAAGILNVLGGDNINTAAIPDPGNNLYVNLNKSIRLPDTNAVGDEGVWWTDAAGFPLSGGALFVHNRGAGNVFAGRNAGNLTLTVGSAVNNSAFGEDALKTITTGSENFAGGKSALESLTTGSDNVAIGAGSMGSSVAISNNIALGTGSGTVLAGNDNVIAGYLAAFNATTADKNIIIGSGAAGTGILTGDNNVFAGYKAAEDATTAFDNVILGYQAAGNITTGEGHVAIGVNALNAITGNIGAVAIGREALKSATNVTGAIAIGNTALKNATTNVQQNGSVAIGNQALLGESDVSGGNVAIGVNAFKDLDNSGADANVVAIGSQAGERWQTGILNTFVGGRAGAIVDGVNPTGTGNGDHNTAIGAFSMGNESAGATVTAERNSLLGAFTGYELTSGTDNVMIGYRAGLNATTRNNSVLIGSSAGENITTDNGFGGPVAIGGNALFTATAFDATDDQPAVAIGFNALRYNTDPGRGNTAIGTQSFLDLLGGAGANVDELNTGIGWAAGQGWDHGSYNTFLGARAGTVYDGLDTSSATGSHNTAVGCFAMGNQTVAVAVTAQRNCTLGYLTGKNLSTGTDNIFIGYTVGNTETTVANKLQIGLATGTGSGQLNKTFICGIRGITTANNNAVAVLVDSANQLGTVSSSARFKENIEDMGPDSEILFKLRPVTFNYKGRDVLERSPGLIAEEVEDVAPWLVAYGADGQCESVRYHEIPVLLLNELKKLKAEVELLKFHKCCKG